MELFLENPHKPFQKRAFVPDSGSFALEGRGLLAAGLRRQGPGLLQTLDLHSGTAAVEIHTSMEHHLPASRSSLNHPERQGSKSPSFEKEGDAQGHIAESGS